MTSDGADGPEQAAQPLSSRGNALRSYVLKLAFLTVILVWPAVVNGNPLYYRDSVSYLKGGDYAMAFAQNVIANVFSHGVDASGANGAVGSSDASSDAAAGPSAAVQEEHVYGVRSITYSLFAYLLRAPGNTMWLMTFVQAAVVGVMLSILFRLYGLTHQMKWFFGVAAAVALVTSASWYVSFAMPDIFAGAALLGVAMLAAHPLRLNLAERLFIVAIAAFAVTAHSSVLLMTGALVVAGAAGVLLKKLLTGKGKPVATIAWLAAPLVAAIAANTAMHYVAFGEASVTAKRYPIPLARSIVDGPARWHLEKNCDKYAYAVCEIFGDDIPTTIDDILWNGVHANATPEQMERVQDEETLILRRATMEYPFKTISIAVRNTAIQAWYFGLTTMRMSRGITIDNNGEYALVYNVQKRIWLRNAFEGIQYLFVFAALGALAYLLIKRRALADDMILMAVIVTGLASNAAICGIFSAMTDRYQGRLIWVFAVAVGMLAFRQFHTRRDTKTVAA